MVHQSYNNITKVSRLPFLMQQSNHLPPHQPNIDIVNTALYLAQISDSISDIQIYFSRTDPQPKNLTLIFYYIFFRFYNTPHSPDM